MMEASQFIDYYEILEISPNATSETIDRIFRYFAQRYHPDNQDTGDRLRFDGILEAYNTLRDPVKRAQYDIRHKSHSGSRWKLAEEASDSKGIEWDRLLGCPAEHLRFHLWYLKEKGWIGKTESGTFAITAEGVDRANSEHHRKTTNKLLTDRSHTG
jgi:curved DNA-binding protein CbpA